VQLPPPLHLLGRHYILRRIGRPLVSHTTTINGLLQKDVLPPKFSSSSQTDPESRQTARYPRISQSLVHGEYPFTVEFIHGPRCSGEA
jgi:hypothetical protein